MKKLILISLLIIFTFLLFLGRHNSKNIARPITESKKLSTEEYTTVKQEFLQVVAAQNPRVALSLLHERITENNAVLRSCHALVHEIGRAAYEKYQNFGEAVKYQDEICNSGYLHGVIEAHFLKSPDFLQR